MGDTLKKEFKVIIFVLITGYIVFNLFYVPNIPNFSFIEVLGMFTVFYLLRYFFEDEYKKRAKIKIAVDIILTTLTFYILQTLLVFFN